MAPLLPTSLIRSSCQQMNGWMEGSCQISSIFMSCCYFLCIQVKPPKPNTRGWSRCFSLTCGGSHVIHLYLQFMQSCSVLDLKVVKIIIFFLLFIFFLTDLTFSLTDLLYGQEDLYFHQDISPFSFQSLVSKSTCLWTSPPQFMTEGVHFH